MNYNINPFPIEDTARHEIWEMLVARDIKAFTTQNWDLVADDFAVAQFLGLHAHGRKNPDSWRLQFPSVESYRDEWLRQAQDSAQIDYAEPLSEALFRATTLRDMDIDGERAVVHKKFDGVISRTNNTPETLNWQTLYFCSLIANRWRITGFIGYLPLPMG